MLSAELGILIGEQKAFTSNAGGSPKFNNSSFEQLLHVRHHARGWLEQSKVDSMILDLHQSEGGGNEVSRSVPYHN